MTVAEEIQKLKKEKDAIISDGILYCSGMIAGEGLVGILLAVFAVFGFCLLYTSPSPRDLSTSRMPSSA